MGLEIAIKVDLKIFSRETNYIVKSRFACIHMNTNLRRFDKKSISKQKKPYIFSVECINE